MTVHEEEEGRGRGRNEEQQLEAWRVLERT